MWKTHFGRGCKAAQNGDTSIRGSSACRVSSSRNFAMRRRGRTSRRHKQGARNSCRRVLDAIDDAAEVDDVHLLPDQGHSAPDLKAGALGPRCGLSATVVLFLLLVVRFCLPNELL